MSSATATETSPPTTAEIAKDATWLVQAIEPPAKMARLIRMTEEGYRGSSFLDDRMMQSPQVARLIALDELAAAAELVSAPEPRWIFHIGHVGSTLIARLIGELPNVLSVREPRSLRDLTTAPDLAPPIVRLMSRSFAEDQVAVVKATSFVSEIAPALLAPDGHALMVYASPRNYIAGILAGENSLKELQALAPVRAVRARARRITLPQARTPADLAAFAWASTMSALEAAAAVRKDAALHWVDFDDWLVERDLAPLARALDIPADEERLIDLKESPILTRYSKATEYEYSPALRTELIAESAQRHKRDIDAAMQMLERLASDSPILATSLGRSKGE